MNAAMPQHYLEPHYVAAPQWVDQLATRHAAVLHPSEAAKALDVPEQRLLEWVPQWHGMPIDQYLKDGGRYRKRRHASYVVTPGNAERVAHRAHWQPLEYNALHGGMTRWFEPVEQSLGNDPDWLKMLVQLGRAFTQAEAQSKAAQTQAADAPWYVEAHQFRIDTEGGMGRPTPEGAHRDGVDYVVVFLVGRHNIMGGESRVFEADGRSGERFTLLHPWTMLVLDDHRVIHETTPIRPLGEGAYRDTLVLTYRRHSFQDAA